MEDEADGRRKWIRVRMGLIGGVIAVGMLAVVGRVYYLQTVRHEKLVEWAKDQTSKEVELNASRGTILDRNGVELAVTTEVPSLYARPGKIDQPRREARRLAPHLEAGFDTILEKLRSDQPFVWLERQTKPDSAEAVRTLEIPGVGTIPEPKRYYPHGELAGQVLGFAGIDGNGLEGVERKYNEMLSGGSYELSGMRDARGRTIFSNSVPELERLQGESVKLTVDERIQRAAERAIRRQVDKYDAKAGYGVVMDVDTGDVLAMTTTPAFDPNRFGRYGPKDWRLRPVTDTFEPGSVFKPFVLASALEEKTVSLQSTFDCEDGAMRIDGYRVGDSHPHEMLTAAEIIQKSSNIGAYKIAQTVGRERFYDYIRSFGFGTRTGLGFRGEQAGLVWPPDRWADVTFANVSFGQGLTATPLQLTTALASIANGGLLVEPRLLSEVRDPAGKTERRTKPRLVRRVVSDSVAERVSRAMSLVTLEEGTGTNAALEDFTVAGKTGTAQKVDPETREYAEDKWVGSFMGFVPAEEPDVAILVMIDEPTETHYGGIVAAPAFREIAEASLSARGVLPLDEEEEFDLGAEEESGEETEERRADDSEEEVEGEERTREGRESGSRPVAESRIVGDEDSSLADSEGEDVVPDLRGKTLSVAVREATELGATPKVEGWGRVVAQRPPPGQALGADRELSLVLAPNREMRRESDRPAEGFEREADRGR